MKEVASRPGQAVAPPLVAGEPIAPGYEVVAHLNRSRTLDVYDAWSEERACRCVAKVLRPDRAGEEEPRRRLIHEGRVLMRLTHLHIVRAYEIFEEPQPVLILETLTGDTLAYLVATHRRRRLPLSDIAFLGIHLCSAMHYLHRQGLLHLDLKPSNVIADRGLAKVIDLSIAAPPGRGRGGVGTRQYMAPEQARGGLLGEATDVWGIGAVLFEATTGQRPFRAEDGRSYEQLERRADPVRSHRRVPAAFAKAVDSCLEPVPAHRPTVAELAGILKGLI